MVDEAGHSPPYRCCGDKPSEGSLCHSKVFTRAPLEDVQWVSKPDGREQVDWLCHDINGCKKRAWRLLGALVAKS